MSAEVWLETLTVTITCRAHGDGLPPEMPCPDDTKCSDRSGRRVVGNVADDEDEP